MSSKSFRAFYFHLRFLEKSPISRMAASSSIKSASLDFRMRVLEFLSFLTSKFGKAAEDQKLKVIIGITSRNMATKGGRGSNVTENVTENVVHLSG